MMYNDEKGYEKDFESDFKNDSENNNDYDYEEDSDYEEEDYEPEHDEEFSNEKKNDFFDGLEDMFPEKEPTENDSTEDESVRNKSVEDEHVEDKSIEEKDTENKDEDVSNNSSEERFTVNAETNIDVDAINAALAKAGISNVSVKVTPAKTKKTTDKLTYDEDGMAICQFDHNHIFDINDLDADMQAQVKKSGLCPDCLDIINKAKAIKGVHINTRTTGVTAGKQIRNMVNFVFNNSALDDNMIANFMDKDYSRTKMGLAYPMLIEVTDKSTDEIKDMRMIGNNKKHYRYSSTYYRFNNRSFLLTNDLYNKNLDKIRNTFLSLNLLDGYVDLTE